MYQRINVIKRQMHQRTQASANGHKSIGCENISASPGRSGVESQNRMMMTKRSPNPITYWIRFFQNDRGNLLGIPPTLGIRNSRKHGSRRLRRGAESEAAVGTL